MGFMCGFKDGDSTDWTHTFGKCEGFCRRDLQSIDPIAYVYVYLNTFIKTSDITG